jgi:hypothetical protein
MPCSDPDGRRGRNGSGARDELGHARHGWFLPRAADGPLAPSINLASDCLEAAVGQLRDALGEEGLEHSVEGALGHRFKSMVFGRAEDLDPPASPME